MGLVLQERMCLAWLSAARFNLWSRRWVCALLVAGLSSPTIARSTEDVTAAEPLQAVYERLVPELRSNPFGRPLVMRSTEQQGTIQGEVYAVVNFPLEQLSGALTSPLHWCEVLMLHLNTQYCGAYQSAEGPLLQLSIGKNTLQALPDTTRMDFAFVAHETATNPLEVTLAADAGPMGTSNYRIVLQAIAIDSKATFVHLRYSYDFGITSRLALGVYLSTVGSGKVGFTKEKAASSQPMYIQGQRAMVERNTMRYFLAINSYLESAHGAEEFRSDARLKSWFAATEVYPRQLREITWANYLAMKHAQIARQNSTQLQ